MDSLSSALEASLQTTLKDLDDNMPRARVRYMTAKEYIDLLAPLVENYLQDVIQEEHDSRVVSRDISKIFLDKLGELRPNPALGVTGPSGVTGTSGASMPTMSFDDTMESVAELISGQHSGHTEALLKLRKEHNRRWKIQHGQQRPD